MAIPFNTSREFLVVSSRAIFCASLRPACRTPSISCTLSTVKTMKVFSLQMKSFFVEGLSDRIFFEAILDRFGHGQRTNLRWKS